MNRFLGRNKKVCSVDPCGSPYRHHRVFAEQNPGFFVGIGIGRRRYKLCVHPRLCEYAHHRVLHTNKCHTDQLENGGFTLLFSALTASLLLAISLSIITISIKESQLSGVARESQYAFYAADAGVECALYWDLVHDKFNPSMPASAITCNGQTVSVGGALSSVFTITYGTVPRCAEVTFRRSLSPFATRIESRGANKCDSSTFNRVERAIVVNY
ncbi:MAG: hypothetical protein G01um101448_648 [Parcubacteria group bacterium Gr01-1014_48]|nr:MAG: hypothetical protein Greene041614_893 [Parcubacteria group bacterium Greene0416_14]TSC73658.1 MAG: hypothetical protein G01um101448_648 [Parcubacteria group bacterium Gr01-1014_48]TSD01106.1 MAG: hypothetical protein Greene101415_509 [Parcubacteria group bacterium Greene1014_15]